jgi:hypothetical protein
MTRYSDSELRKTRRGKEAINVKINMRGGMTGRPVAKSESLLPLAFCFA